MDINVETIDFGLDDNLYAVGLKGALQDFSSDTLHAHPFHQVLQIKNGVALLHDSLGRRPQYGSMIAFIPASVPHRTEVIGDAVEYQSLYFNRALIRRRARSIVIFRMSSLGLSLLEYLNGEAPGRDMTRGIRKDCVALFVKILARDLRKGLSPIMLPDARTDAAGAVCRFLEEHYRETITSEGLSRALPLSFRQLSRKFTSDMGLSIFEYLRVVRMLKASIALSTTEMKITGIACECGYDSLSSFFTDFRRIFGLSPAEFRRRNGHNGA